MHECIAYNAIARSIMEKDGVNDDFHFWVKKIKDVSFHINNYAIYLTLREAEIYWYIDMGKYELSLDKIRELSCEAEARKALSIEREALEQPHISQGYNAEHQSLSRVV